MVTPPQINGALARKSFRCSPCRAADEARQPMRARAQPSTPPTERSARPTTTSCGPVHACSTTLTPRPARGSSPGLPFPFHPPPPTSMSTFALTLDRKCTQSDGTFSPGGRCIFPAPCVEPAFNVLSWRNSSVRIEYGPTRVCTYAHTRLYGGRKRTKLTRRRRIIFSYDCTSHLA